jgi:hypothetical protein
MTVRMSFITAIIITIRSSIVIIVCAGDQYGRGIVTDCITILVHGLLSDISIRIITVNMFLLA